MAQFPSRYLKDALRTTRVEPFKNACLVCNVGQPSDIYGLFYIQTYKNIFRIGQGREGWIKRQRRRRQRQRILQQR